MRTNIVSDFTVDTRADMVDVPLRPGVLFCKENHSLYGMSESDSPDGDIFIAPTENGGGNGAWGRFDSVGNDIDMYLLEDEYAPLANGIARITASTVTFTDALLNCLISPDGFQTITFQHVRNGAVVATFTIDCDVPYFISRGWEDDGEYVACRAAHAGVRNLVDGETLHLGKWQAEEATETAAATAGGNVFYNDNFLAIRLRQRGNSTHFAPEIMLLDSRWQLIMVVQCVYTMEAGGTFAGWIGDDTPDVWRAIWSWMGDKQLSTVYDIFLNDYGNWNQKPLHYKLEVDVYGSPLRLRCRAYRQPSFGD